MTVTIIWDTTVKEEFAVEGLKLNRKIWSDMTKFEGYMDHQLLIDADNPAHFVIVSHWISREIADHVLDIYKNEEPVRLLAPMLEGARKRNVFYEDD